MIPFGRSSTAGRAAPGTGACRRAGGSGPGPTHRDQVGGPASSGTSLVSSVSWRLRSTLPRCSRRLSPARPLTSSTWSTSASSEPNSATHFDAVFSPTPGMPGRLSLGSPRSAAKSGYCAGVQPVLLGHRGRGEPGHVADAAPGHQDRDVVADQLERVPVAGDDQHLHAAGGGLRRQRGDEVVGLVPGQRQPRDAERVEHLEDQAQLTLEVGGSLLAVRLVLDVLLVPEGRLAPVERDGDVRRLLVPQHVDQHRREPVDGVRRLPRRGREVLGGQREEGTVGERVPVEQEQEVAPGRGRQPAGPGSWQPPRNPRLRHALRAGVCGELGGGGGHGG